jgi:hypothetical protein
MTTRRSARVYWLIGKIGTSRLVSRLHPHVYRLTGGRARGTDGAERDLLWSLAARGYPGYELYATWTHRLIPVIALEPVEA